VSEVENSRYLIPHPDDRCCCTTFIISSYMYKQAKFIYSRLTRPTEDVDYFEINFIMTK
ncbi:unnamed protein product, partial [Amoebophrya sp. A120]